MANQIFKIALCFFGFFGANVAAGTITAKIEKIELHGYNWGTYNPNDLGVLSLYIEGMPKSCNQNNGQNRVVILTDHPLYQSVYSMALAAKLANKNIFIHYLDTCNVRAGGWDFGYVSLSE